MGSVRVPRRGDLVWLTFDARKGHEQAGRRPALVLSPESYNRKVGLAVVCAVTSHARGYPFEVPLPDGLGIEGVVLSDHVKSLDWRARNATRIQSAPQHVLDAVTERLLLLVADGGG